MPTLLEFQQAFRTALLGGGPAIADLDIAPDGLAIEDRLDIYRTNFFASLERALAATFPAVRRLVDVRFFAFAADSFIRALPPHRPCLAEYGAAFADFLARFEPCRNLCYLPDLARLEWRINEAAHADDAAPLTPDALAAVALGAADRLVFTLHPSYRLLASPFPIDRIWRANHGDDETETAIDLSQGDTRLEIWRQGGEALLRALDPAGFSFRAGLAAGRTLAAATDASLAVDQDFDLRRQFAELFQQEIVVGFRIASEEPLP
jgi:hypothetical protein